MAKFPWFQKVLISDAVDVEFLGKGHVLLAIVVCGLPNGQWVLFLGPVMLSENPSLSFIQIAIRVPVGVSFEEVILILVGIILESAEDLVRSFGRIGRLIVSAIALVVIKSVIFVGAEVRVEFLELILRGLASGWLLVSEILEKVVFVVGIIVPRPGVISPLIMSLILVSVVGPLVEIVVSEIWVCIILIIVIVKAPVK